MSKKLPYSGSAAKKGRKFYSSGISQLMNRIDKLEHQVFCCSDDTDEVIDVTSSTYTAAVNKDGAFYTLNLAGGITFNLPEATAANVGWNCTIAVETAFTGTMTIATGSTSDLFVGSLAISQASSATAGHKNTFVPDVSNDDQIVADADTKGRLAGGLMNIKIIDVNRVFVDGRLIGAGTAATPFA